MKRIVVVMALLATFLWSGNCVWAYTLTDADITLNGEYTVNTQVSAQVGGFYTYTYSVTNNNQGTGTSDPPRGLNGFVLQVPLSATIQNITSPLAPPGSLDPTNSYWRIIFQGPGALPFPNGPSPQSGYQWLAWGSDGLYPEYEIGQTAVFSFQANAPEGSNLGIVSTGPQGSYFVGAFTGPTSPVPVPSALVLLGSGLLGLTGWRYRARKS